MTVLSILPLPTLGDHKFRKRLVALLLFAVVVAALCPTTAICQDDAAVRREFQHPDKQYRPMVRWWWPGDAVTDTEIQREIGLLDNAWFGGAEVQPFTLYFQNGLSPEDKEKVSHGFATPNFFQHIHTAVEAARSHGMWIDDTFGTGWPLGGGVAITPELASLELRYADTVITGPGNVSATVAIPQWKPDMLASAMIRTKDYFPEGWQERFDARSKIIAVVAIRSKELTPATADSNAPSATEVLDERTTIVLTDRMHPDGTLDWQVPAGKWHIFVFRQIPTRQLVVNASGAGPQLVLDHFSRAAFEAHAAHVGDPLVAANASDLGRSLRSVFCDSLEVIQFLAWSDDFLAEFKKRRGYDLVPYLPVLRVAGYNNQNDSVPGGLPFFDVAGGDSIRKDYWQTVSELITERFYEPFNLWAAQHHLLSRVQAHGAPADILKIYGEASIPETEQLGGNNTVNFMKLASSAGYDYGHPIVSSESFVFRGNPQINTPLSLKANADKLLISGVNQIIYHGFPYKLDAGIKGIGWFPFRAVSTPVLETNPIWPYLPKLNEYITRLQYIAQHGKSDLQVAIFRSSLNDDDTGPSPASGALKDPFPSIEQELTKAGYSFGFVNPDALKRSSATSAAFTTVGGGKYRALVIPKESRISPETLPLLQSYAAAHLPIIFVGGLPGEDVSFKNMEADRKKVIDGLKHLSDIVGVYHADRTTDLSSRLATVLKPQVRFSSGASLPFLKKTIGNVHFYLLTNPSDTASSVKVQFAEQRAAEVWDPWTGSVAPAASQSNTQGVSMNVSLPPYGSELIAFGTARWAPVAPVSARPGKRQDVGAAGWHVDAVGNSEKGVGISLHVDMPKLLDWLSQPELHNFSGNGTYSTQIVIAERDFKASERIVLDLGAMKDAAQVRVNGKPAGMLIVPPYALDIKSLLHAGENELQITVSNTLTNYVSGLKGSAVGTYQTGHFEPLSSGLLGPVTLKYELPALASRRGHQAK